jgi:phosphohistidine phosphatase
MTSSDQVVSIHLLRHADAGDPETWQGDDAVRPLSPKGVRQAERLGRHLVAAGFEPDVVLTSPKLRALQTAEIVGRALGIEPRTEEQLAGAPGLRELARILADGGSPRRPVLVGHDPEFSEMLAELTVSPSLRMKKGALARVDVRGHIGAGTGELRWLLPPDLLPRGS